MDLQQVIAGHPVPPSQPQTPEQNQNQSQNLIKQAKSNVPVWERGFYKSIIVDVLVLLSAGLFGYSYYHYLSAGLAIWMLLGALTFFAVMSALQVFLSKKDARTFLIIFGETLLLMGFFYQDNWQVLGITGLVVLALLLWGFYSAKARLKNSIRIAFLGVSGTSLSKFVTAMLLFMILIYVPQINGNPLLVSQQNFRTFFDWTSGFINSFYPNVSLKGSFGGFAQSVSEMELKDNPNFQSLSDTQKQVAIQQQTQQFSNSFLQNSSGTVASSSPTSDAFYGVLDGILNSWKSQSGEWFDVGWATVLFIGLRSVGVLFVWFAEFMALIIYEILLASGFMKITEEQHIREIIGY